MSGVGLRLHHQFVVKLLVIKVYQGSGDLGPCTVGAHWGGCGGAGRWAGVGEWGRVYARGARQILPLCFLR